MNWMQTSGVLAVCLGLAACGSSKSGTGDDNDPITGQTAGDNGGATNGGAGSGLKDGDAVDLDGDGQKDDGVAIDEDGDGKVDGVDTDGDGKVDKPLPGGSGGDTTAGGGNGSSSGSGTTAGGGTTAGSDDDASVDDPLSCNGVGICDDNFKDTCDGNPDSCPTTQASGIDEPAWDCAGEPPANVYAYATFPDGTTVAGANLAPGACVVFFEGAKNLFYAKWFKFGPKVVTDSCSKYEGCICPKGTLLAGQSYDRRLYAFTWSGDAKCPQIGIIDHKGGTPDSALNQPVSNDCRKYLYALHTEGSNGVPSDGQGAYDLPFSYVAGSLAALKLRLQQFPKVEVACIDVQTAGALPWAQLMASDVKTNAGFKKKN